MLPKVETLPTARQGIASTCIFRSGKPTGCSTRTASLPPCANTSRSAALPRRLTPCANASKPWLARCQKTAALRHAAGFRARYADSVGDQRPGPAPLGAGADGQGTHCARHSKTRQPYVWLGGPRHRPAFGRRALQVDGENRHGARAVIDKLYQEIARGLRAPELKERMVSEGMEIIASTPDKFSAYIKSETDKWSSVIKAAGIKPQ